MTIVAVCRSAESSPKGHSFEFAGRTREPWMQLLYRVLEVLKHMTDETSVQYFTAALNIWGIPDQYWLRRSVSLPQDNQNIVPVARLRKRLWRRCPEP